MSRPSQPHVSAVNAWADGCMQNLSPANQIETYERAFRALWICARKTLSALTLSAVMERAIFESTEHYPFLISLEVSEAGIRWAALKDASEGLMILTMQEGFKFILADFISLLSKITNGVLTPELHATLAKVKHEPRFQVLRRTGEEE